MLITCGVSGGLFLAILATIDPGDEAIFLDPYFVMYKHLLTMAGGKSVIVDSYPDFRFHADRVEQAITPKTKLLILNSPEQPDRRRDEPTPKCEPPSRSRASTTCCIISDEIYEPFLYGQRRRRRHGRPAVADEAVRQHDHPPRLLQEPRDDRLAARLRGRAGGDHRADDQAPAVHVRLRPVAAPVRRAGGDGRRR